MRCPYCDKEMQAGVIRGDGRETPRFIRNGEKKHSLADYINGKGALTVNFSWNKFLLDANYCTSCKKFVIENDVL